MDQRVQDKEKPVEQVLRVFHQTKKKAEVLVSGTGKPKRLYVEKQGDKWQDQFGKQHKLFFPEA